MTFTKVEPSHPKKKLLLLAGTCDILAIIVAVVCISLAISCSPGFSLTQNWVSNLTGMSYASFLNVSRPVVNSPTTEILIRSQFIIGGILGIVFLVGLFYDSSAPSHRLGAVLAILGTGASVR